MIADKNITVTYREGNETHQITMTVTGEQIKQTVMRRMNTLMPNAKITDITEKVGELDLKPTVRK